VSAPATPRDSAAPSAILRHALPCLLLAALTFAVFSNALRCQFVSFDDWFLIEENTRIQSLAPLNIGRMFTVNVSAVLLGDRGWTDSNTHAWLPLRELSYALDYRFWGLLPVGYHLTNVLLHAANALLAYAVLLWLVKRRALAWLGAAVFAVHPVQVESVTWASGRRDVLYAFFYLLAFLAFVAHERRSGWRRWVLYGLSLACLAASLLSKASAMTLPAVLGLAILAFGESDGTFWRRMSWTVPHWVVAVVLTLLHWLVARQAEVVKGPALGSSLANAPLIFAEYARLLFFPVHLVAPHGTGSLRWGSDGAQILLLAGMVAGLVVVAFWAAPRRSLALFCIGWWFLLLLPVANFIPISVLVAERYLYLPQLGACGLGVAVLGGLMTTRWRRGIGVTCAAAAVALLSLGTHGRNRVWANSRTFWQDGASKWPSIPVMRIGLATAYADVNDFERAWNQYMMVALSWGRAVSYNKEHVSLVSRGLKKFYDTLARQREGSGRSTEALEVYETMVRLLQEEKSPEPWVKLAEAHERRGQWVKAREAVLAAQTLVRQVQKEKEELAKAHEEQGDDDKAREARLAAEKLDADYPGLAEWVKRLEAKAEEAKRGQEGGGGGPKE